MDLLTTEQMLEQITGTIDTQDCVRIIGPARRSYSLCADEKEVWGCDPDGEQIDSMPKSEFLQEWADAKWEVNLDSTR